MQKRDLAGLFKAKNERSGLIQTNCPRDFFANFTINRVSRNKWKDFVPETVFFGIFRC